MFIKGRICKKCGETKRLEAFECYDKERGWRRWECRDCTRERTRAWTARSKDHIKSRRREYYEENKAEIKARVSKWVKENPDKRRKNALSYYYRLQLQAIEAYGGFKCACCGETEPMFLSIDHIENDGNKHRKELGNRGGAAFYKWLRENDYPKGFQVLCMNCNHGKHRNGGICPHQVTCNDYPDRE